MAKKNQSKNESNNTSAATLSFTTYTSQKGKVIPVVIGFSGKDDPRVEYVAQVGKDGEPSAVRGRYSSLPINGTATPCVMWGAAPCWHEVAKKVAEVFSDFDNMTQEAYDEVCDMAEAAYQLRKAEGQKEDAERKANRPKAETAKPAAKKPTASKSAAKGKNEKPAASKPAAKGKSEKPATSKPAAKGKQPNMTEVPVYTRKQVEGILRDAFGALAKAMNADAKAFEPLIASAMKVA